MTPELERRVQRLEKMAAEMVSLHITVYSSLISLWRALPAATPFESAQEINGKLTEISKKLDSLIEDMGALGTP